MLEWYAVFTKPRGENQALNALLAKDVEVYLPTIRVRPVNPRARHTQPFFPRYLFVRADLDAIGLSTINWTPGVTGVVTAGTRPVPVPEELIAALRKRLAHLEPPPEVAPVPFRPGEPVVIVGGPLQGINAVFDTRLDGKGRVRVLVEILQRQVAVDLDLGHLHKMDPRVAQRQAEARQRPRGRINRRK